MSSSRSLRVAFVINGLGTGGAERSIVDMLPVYLASGIEPRVVCLFRRSVGVHDLVESMGIPITVLRDGSLLRRARELEALLRPNPSDLVHTSIFEADMTGRIAARRVHIPVLTSLVNTSYDSSRLDDPNVRRWKLEALRQVEGFTARRMTDHFHALTQTVKTASIAALGIRPQKITVIPRGRDPRRLGRKSSRRRADVRKMLDAQDSTPVVLAVGRQEFQKGHVYLVDAMSRVLSHNPEATLWMAGREGTMSQEIRDRIRQLGMSQSVQLLGHRDDVPDLMAAADVLAFPSLYEGLGGTLIEAMALELPIVASNLPAMVEVTESGYCATLVEPARPEELADAVLDVLANPASRQLQIAAARNRFEKVYTTDQVGDEMVELMCRVADSR